MLWKALSLPYSGSRSFAFCFVLRGRSAQQQAAQSPSILDTSYGYLDSGFRHRRLIHIHVATFQTGMTVPKSVADEITIALIDPMMSVIAILQHLCRRDADTPIALFDLLVLPT